MSIYSGSILIWQEKVSPLDTATTAVVTFAESDHSAASVENIPGGHEIIRYLGEGHWDSEIRSSLQNDIHK